MGGMARVIFMGGAGRQCVVSRVVGVADVLAVLTRRAGVFTSAVAFLAMT